METIELTIKNIEWTNFQFPNWVFLEQDPAYWELEERIANDPDYGRENEDSEADVEGWFNANTKLVDNTSACDSRESDYAYVDIELKYSGPGVYAEFTESCTVTASENEWVQPYLGKNYKLGKKLLEEYRNGKMQGHQKQDFELACWGEGDSPEETVENNSVNWTTEFKEAN